MLDNDQLRIALKLWVQSDQFERYQFGVVSDQLKRVLAWMLSGAFCGFIFGFVVGLMVK